MITVCPSILWHGVSSFLRKQSLVMFVTVNQAGLVSTAQKTSMSVWATPVWMGEPVWTALMLSVVNAHISGLDFSVTFPRKVHSASLIPQMLTVYKCHPWVSPAVAFPLNNLLSCSVAQRLRTKVFPCRNGLKFTR